MARVITPFSDKCIGCKRCVKACAIEHGGVFREDASRTHVFTFKEPVAEGEKPKRYSVTIQCRQCEDAACVAVCPTGAMHQGPEGSHLVEFDADACIDCQLCVSACAFGCVRFDEQAGEIVKCDLCGGDPKCVAACQNCALEFLEADDEVLEQRRARTELLKNGW